MNVATTSSSSSPDFEVYPTKSENILVENFLFNNSPRTRNGLLGGSMRVPGPRIYSPGLRSSIRIRPIDEDIYSLHGSERGVDVASPLVPNGIRHTRSVSNALQPGNSPRPPPYVLTKQASKSSSAIKPPPPYPGRTPVSF